MFKRFLTLISVGLLATTLGCSSNDKIDTNTADGAYKLGERYEKDERYEEAITYFSEVKNKHPYSRYATDSELKIADIEYKRENFVESEAAYKLFKELHPDHPQSAYVTFRLGLSLYKQLPATIDRDLSLANKALIYFDEVLTTYSRSSFVKEARETKEKVQKMLAEKDLYIARFYYKKEKWLSAMGRYEDLFKNQMGFGYDKEIILGLTLSAYKAKEMDKAKEYFRVLLARHPNSPELAAARKEMSDGF
ncbi:MAG: outer membrane protein assembly factor BamD [Bdellovibrionota bacterium]